MKIIIQLFLLQLLISSCNTPSNNSGGNYTKPEDFLSEIIPENLMAHAGVFSPDLKEYYYTLSDVEFSNFTVMRTQKKGNAWTEPDTAFFNSEYNEHGVHFSPDHQWLYFSSTRPLDTDTLPNTWHIWRSKRTDTSWGTPTFVNIPGFSEKLISHPTTTETGRLYFHAGNTDYSDLTLYYSDQLDEKFLLPVKISLPGNMNQGTFTPFVSPDESYLIFAKTIENGEELYISYLKDGMWNSPIRLNDEINTNNLGNPYVTPDGKHLYYASGEISAYGLPFNWIIKRVGTSNILPDN